MGLPQDGARFLLLYPAVIACSLLAGRDAGIAATIAGSIAVAVYLALQPELRVDVPIAMGQLLLFLVTGMAIALVFSELKRTMRGLETANQELSRAHSAAIDAEQKADLLLSELRHRVRNDLANVIAILRLQARAAERDSSGQLEAAADRLQVLVKLHQTLSRHGSSPVVDMKEFIHEICSHFRTTMLALRPIAIVPEMEPLHLPSERAMPVGLIVNELLTNAIKYAYPDGKSGTVCVTLKVDDGRAFVAVEDDGVGFMPPCEGEPPSTGLGHKLVQSLTRQLRGNFSCESVDNGTRCRISFPLEA